MTYAKVKWIMILFYILGSTVAIEAIYFDSQEACLDAAEKIKEKHTRAECFPSEVVPHD